jgi:hypothetical protein
VNPPNVAWDSEPTTCIAVNNSWLSYVGGLVRRGLQPGFWDGQTLEGQDAINWILNAMALGNCPPAASCELNYVAWYLCETPMTNTLIAASDGYLPTVQAALYTVPAGKTFYVTKITLSSGNTLSTFAVLFVNRSGVSRQLHFWNDFQFGWTASGGEGLVLQEGDSIEGWTGLADTIHYTISGVEQSP